MTHFCSDRVTHRTRRAFVRKPKVGKAISSPPKAGCWVRFREQGRVISRECRSNPGVWFSYWTRSFKPRGQPCATGEVSTRLRVPIGHLGQEPVVARCAPPLLPSTLRRSVSSAPQTDSCK